MARGVYFEHEPVWRNGVIWAWRVKADPNPFPHLDLLPELPCRLRRFLGL